MSIRILLADDHRLFREGLRSLLKEEADMEVIAEADNGRTAVQQACELKPDVVAMDISMPDLNGIEATRQIAAKLKISIKTIDSHRHQIMERLNLHSVAELTKFAIREGLTSLGD